MRIASLELSGFRAFSSSVTLDLDADTVLVVGANGQGKTSLFDAILWASVGEIPRLGSTESVVSLFSSSGEARVALSLKDDQEGSFRVIRRSDGKAGQLTLDVGASSLRGPQAETALLQTLWPSGLASVDPKQSLCAALERGVYLQQDLLTAFLSAATDQERFSAISELVGAGRVTEFQAALERSRLAWSRVTNVREAESRELKDRLDRVRSQLKSTIAAEPLTVQAEAWRAWWTEASDLGLALTEAPAIDGPTAPGRLDSALKELQAIHLAAERRRQMGDDLSVELRALPAAPSADIAGLRKARDEVNLQLNDAKKALAAAEEHAALLRRRQVELTEQRDEVRVLAQLALRHLSERCPVCDQTYDKGGTRRRLEALAKADPSAVGPPGEMPDISALAARVEGHEDAAASAQRRFVDADKALRAWSGRRQQLSKRLSEFGISSETAEPFRSIEQLMDALSRQVDRLSAARKRGEELALAIARAGQHARQAELELEAGEMERQLAAAQRDLTGRQQTGHLVSSLIEALRDASADIVEDQLHRLEPLLQRIYATADPHPAFRVVRLISRMRQGKGRIMSSVEDPLYRIESETPGAILSSSQMNVLAVSVFLTLNLGMPGLPLRSTILDDPLQSLDDLNLLGLVDLLRRMRERRQVFISTHDSRFAALLERKLRPVADGQRTIVVDLEGWSREGPKILQRDVITDRTPLRMAV
jgi:DNA repair exonuclease SbcCD ATPase subunit